MHPALAALLLLMSSYATLRPATVSELKAGKSAGTLRFDTDDLTRNFYEDKTVDKVVRHAAAEEAPEIPGDLWDLTFKLPDKKAGDSRRLRIYKDDEKANVVVLEPWWPASGPHDVKAQAKLLRLEIGGFCAASKRLGTLLTTDSPNLYVGLTRSAPPTNDLEIAYVVLVRRADWLPLVAASRTSPEIAKLVTEALARKDAAQARAALPDPLPSGLAQDSEIGRALQSIDALETAQLSSLTKSAEGNAAAQIAALGKAARLAGRSFPNAPGGLGETCSTILTQLARHLAADADGLRITDPLRAAFLEAMASDAREANPPKAPGGGIEAVAVRLGVVYPEIGVLASPDPAEAAGALARIRSAVDSDAAIETRRLYNAALAQGRERLLPGISRAAADAESKNLLATSAAYRLMEIALHDGSFSEGVRLDWEEAVASAGDTSLGKAQSFLARLALGLVPGVTSAPGPRAFADEIFVYPYEDGDVTSGWPLNRAKLKGTKLQRQLAAAGVCTLSRSNQRFVGETTSTQTTRTNGQVYGTWTYDEADVRAWESQVASLQERIASHESAAEYSTKPLGTEVRGAAGVTVVRQEVDAHGNDLGSSVIASSPQNVYRIGVGKAAKEERQRVEEAKAALSYERPELEALLKSKPVIGQSWTGPKRIMGTTTSVTQHAIGRFSRDLQLTCDGETFRAHVSRPVDENFWKVDDQTIASDEDLVQYLDSDLKGLGAVVGKAAAARGIKAVAGLEGVSPETRAREAAWIRYFFGVDEPPPVATQEIFYYYALKPLSDLPMTNLRVLEKLPDTMFEGCQSDSCVVEDVREWMTTPTVYTTKMVRPIWDAFRDSSQAVEVMTELFPWIADKDAWPAFLDGIGANKGDAAALKLRDATIGLPE